MKAMGIQASVKIVIIALAMLAGGFYGNLSAADSSTTAREKKDGWNKSLFTDTSKEKKKSVDCAEENYKMTGRRATWKDEIYYYKGKDGKFYPKKLKEFKQDEVKYQKLKTYHPSTKTYTYSFKQVQ